MGLTILATKAPTTQPAPSATRGSSRLAGSVATNTSVAKHAAATVGPAAVINVPNPISSKHERAARAQPETKSLKLQLSEMF
jgi:hypothetical protein